MMKLFVNLQGESNSINIILGLHHLNLLKSSKSFILYFICWLLASGFPTWGSSLWSICYNFRRRRCLHPQESFVHHGPDSSVPSMPYSCGTCHCDCNTLLFPELLILGICVWKGISFSICWWSNTTDLLASE